MCTARIIIFKTCSVENSYVQGEGIFKTENPESENKFEKM
jgi:hypothetical protein